MGPAGSTMVRSTLTAPGHVGVADADRSREPFLTTPQRSCEIADTFPFHVMMRTVRQTRASHTHDAARAPYRGHAHADERAAERSRYEVCPRSHCPAPRSDTG
ncbi:hypothetical protein Krad_2429 [Kineococcus radiotolerans SRS30216 = ATCC BAA-149]|uniref:Uncharacterized protein n=1 Tax=Kineococcus radiotolerans (strain ATCC BAA-149 / DSM 14245 / SRS30216) TaxID=266940 RepID=A6WAS0_KINRD|nr:hypothetical protein Krad_2429 [Kineococcus radiotolerans SRS30216 = ATCC BAA-149]